MQADHWFMIIVSVTLACLTLAVLANRAATRRQTDAIRDIWNLNQDATAREAREAAAVARLYNKLLAMGVPAEAVEQIAYPDDTDPPIR